MCYFCKNIHHNILEESMRTITRMCGIIFLVLAIILITTGSSQAFFGDDKPAKPAADKPGKSTPEKEPACSPTDAPACEPTSEPSSEPNQPEAPAAEKPEKSYPVREPKVSTPVIPNYTPDGPSIGPSRPSFPLPGEGGSADPPSECGADIAIGAGVGAAKGAFSGSVGKIIWGAVEGGATAAVKCKIKKEVKKSMPSSTSNYVVPKGAKTGWKSSRSHTP